MEMFGDDTVQVGCMSCCSSVYTGWWGPASALELGVAASGAVTRCATKPLSNRPSALHPNHFPGLEQGAVLEPQGVVEIKFRAPELIATMHRIDPVIVKLKVRESPIARGERGDRLNRHGTP